MSKSKMILICVIIAIVTCTAITYAYMVKNTDYKKVEFTPATVSCEVHETTDTGNSTSINQKTSITVENKSNIEAYMRVKLVSYWITYDENGNEIISSKVSEDPQFALSDKWIAGSDNTYYCVEPIGAGDFTPELLASPINLSKDSEYLQVIEVFAEAIQSVPDEAVEESWKVTLDEDGIISEVK